MLYIEKIDSDNMPHKGDWYSVVDNMTVYRWDGEKVFEIDEFNYLPVDEETEAKITKAIKEYKENEEA